MRNSKDSDVIVSAISEKKPSYFWSRHNIPNLYLLVPLITVLTGIELILVVPGINPVVIEGSMIIPAVVIGVFLVGSARRFEIELAEAAPTHYLTRWKSLKIMWYVAFGLAGTLSVAAIVFRPQNLLVGGFPFSLVEAIGLLYLIVFYTMILPLRFWSPKASDLARIYFSASVRNGDSETTFLEMGIRSFARVYAHRTGLHLQQSAYVNAIALDHEDKRTLAFRLQHAVKSADYESGIQAIIAVVNAKRELIISGRKTSKEVRDTLAWFVQMVIWGLTIIVLLLVITGRIPVSISLPG